MADLVARIEDALAEAHDRFVPSDTQGYFHELAEAVTAALRLDDPETVERVARALYERMVTRRTLSGPWPSWENADDGLRCDPLEDARAVIAALLGAGAEPE